MTGYSSGVHARLPIAGRARRIRTLIGGRQTRTDIVVSTMLLVVAFVAMVTNLVLTVGALPSFRECAAMACSDVGDLDVLAISFVTSLVIGTTFGFHALLNLLNRRNAWGYALLDAVISVGCLVGGLAWISAA